MTIGCFYFNLPESSTSNFKWKDTQKSLSDNWSNWTDSRIRKQFQIAIIFTETDWNNQEIVEMNQLRGVLILCSTFSHGTNLYIHACITLCLRYINWNTVSRTSGRYSSMLRMQYPNIVSSSINQTNKSFFVESYFIILLSQCKFKKKALNVSIWFKK